MLANASFASTLGRPDLAMWAGSAGVANTKPPPVSPGDVLSGGLGVAPGTGEGRVSAGMIALCVLGLMGFYIWTRGFQASGG